MSILKIARNEVRDMTIEQATTRLAEERRRMFDLRMQSARGEVKDVRIFAKTRKMIARLQYKVHMAALEEALGFGEPEFVQAPDDDAATEGEA